MDSLMLEVVARSLAHGLTGLIVRSVRQETPHRIRWVLESEDGSPRSFVFSLRPGKPWLGRPCGPWPDRGEHPGPLARSLQTCVGSRLLRIEKDPLDRRVTLFFSDGCSVVLELMPQRPNAAHLDRAGRVLVAGRLPKSDRQRLAHAVPYLPPPPRANALDLRSAVLDRLQIDQGSLAGMGRAAPAYLDRMQCASTSQGLIELIAGLDDGTVAPCLCHALRSWRSRQEEQVDAREGRLCPEGISLEFGLPASEFCLEDPASTVGLFYEIRDRWERIHERARSLLAHVTAELRRVEAAVARARADRDGFEDPERYRRFGEALLAGLPTAEIRGERACVNDPYSEDGARLEIPIDPALSLAENAQRNFSQYRRAQRGFERAQLRVQDLELRSQALASTLREYEVAEISSRNDSSEQERIEALERGLLALGLAVGLVPGRATGKGGSIARNSLSGIRMYTSADGWEMLVGRTAAENHRLTFKVAGPEDYWLHALGVTGAHVVVRLPIRGAKPTKATLVEAAQLAGWFSDARSNPQVDVQYTRRKYVRRPRGATAGTVVVKKFETLRIRPRNPDPTPGRD